MADTAGGVINGASGITSITPGGTPGVNCGKPTCFPRSGTTGPRTGNTGAGPLTPPTGMIAVVAAGADDIAAPPPPGAEGTTGGGVVDPANGGPPPAGFVATTVLTPGTFPAFPRVARYAANPIAPGTAIPALLSSIPGATVSTAPSASFGARILARSGMPIFAAGCGMNFDAKAAPPIQPPMPPSPPTIWRAKPPPATGTGAAGAIAAPGCCPTICCSWPRRNCWRMRS